MIFSFCDENRGRSKNHILVRKIFLMLPLRPGKGQLYGCRQDYS